MSDALATKANLFYRHLAPDPICPLCLSAQETAEHVVFACPWVRLVWFGMSLGYTPSLQHLSTFDIWLEQLTFPLHSSSFEIRDLLSKLSFVLWNVWKHRCLCVFEHLQPNPMLVIQQIQMASSEFLRATSAPSASTHVHNQAPLVRPPPKPNWMPPPLAFIKINCDASWTSSGVGIAAIARNASGLLVGGLSLTVISPSPLYAEALAAALSVFLASHLAVTLSHRSGFILESDCLQLVQLLHGTNSSPDWLCASLVALIRARTVALCSSNWSWISRCGNQAAHLMANLARRKICLGNWVLCPPVSLLQLLRLEPYSLASV